MIEGLPEKRSDIRSDITAKPSPRSRRKPAVSIAQVTDNYEPEVIEFVTNHLDAGFTKNEVVKELAAHDFTPDEARRLIDAIAKDRPRNIQLAPKQGEDELFARLRDRFPDLEPVKSKPGFVTINGIGTTIYGSRDHDPHTGTYVKTQVLSVFYIPLFAVTAYRVADAPGGWYFLGRHPLSPLAKAWNWFSLGAICVGIFAIMARA